MTGVPLPGMLGGFYAFDGNQRGGAYVATGDVNGDKTPDIIVGSGKGVRAEAKAFSGKDGSALRDVTPFAGTGGVQVAAADLDADGIVDVVARAASGAAGAAAVSGATGESIPPALLAFWEGFAAAPAGTPFALGVVAGPQAQPKSTPWGTPNGTDTVWVTADETEIGEEGGTVAVTFHHAGPDGSGVFQFDMLGTATLGTDYTASAGPLAYLSAAPEWADISTNDPVMILTAQPDDLREGDETIVITLTDASGATGHWGVVSTSSVTIRIKDHPKNRATPPQCPNCNPAATDDIYSLEPIPQLSGGVRDDGVETVQNAHPAGRGRLGRRGQGRAVLGRTAAPVLRH